MKRTLAWLAAICLGSGLAQADLSFPSKRNTYEAKPAEESFETVFEFTNTGKHPVIVEQVDSNCGCISAATDKKRYEIGESGTVTAVFKIGSAEGTQSKSLTVFYAEEKPVVRPKVVGAGTEPPPAAAAGKTTTPTAATGARQRQQLTVEVHVPSLIRIEPKVTKWPVGAAAETKTVEVTMNHEEPIVIREVRSSRENMKVEVKELEKGKRYQLHLTPEVTDKVQLGMLTIQTDCAIKRHQKKLAFFSIHRPTRSPQKAATALVPRPNTGIVSPGNSAAKTDTGATPASSQE